MSKYQQETIYQTPPLAGRPPFATDDDSVYDQQPPTQPAKRIRQPPPPDPNARTSAYNVYDNYINGGNRDSGIGALGMGLMNGDMDNDDENPFNDNKRPTDDLHTKPSGRSIPLAAPQPGYAAPVAALNLARPSPVASPEGRQPTSSSQMSQIHAPKPLTLVNNMNNSRLPPPAPISVPSTPHPLQPPMTPIMPVFARPSTATGTRDVKFAATTPILRGNAEETLLPKRGEKGDDFWRRFSMVAQEENAKPSAQKQSPWLRKTQSGTTRMSRWVWIVGMILLLCIAGGIGIGWYIAHKSTSHDAPTAIGGSANEKALVSSSVAVSSGVLTASKSLHVSPTNTVARRDFIAEARPTNGPISIIQLPESPSGSNSHPESDRAAFVRAVPPSRHRRIHNNRTSHRDHY